MSPSNNEGKIDSHSKKIVTLVFLVFLSLVYNAHQISPIVTTVYSSFNTIFKNESVTANASISACETYSSAYVHSMLNDPSTPDGNVTSVFQEWTTSLPIYLVQINTKEVAAYRTTWGTLSAKWNRTTQYNDIINTADTIPCLPPIEPSRRLVVMIHCGPKTGSTTLRLACRINYHQTCGISRNKKGRYPLGYQDASELYPLIRSCTNTSHFCAKNVTLPENVPPFNDVQFLHMFPFRTYDDWAASALKQAYDRGSDGCTKAEMLFDTCTASNMEIDFRKYGKTDLAMFKNFAIQRIREKHESHIFLLYHHRELNEVLSLLSTAYRIPLLPGSDGKEKLKRPEGTCNESILHKFHNCFSSQLMELE